MLIFEKLLEINMFKRAALLTALAVAGIGAANAAEVIKLYKRHGRPG